jgi:hypothetical protein
VALYTNYYLGFLLFGLFAALAVTRQWRQASAYLVSIAIAGVAFLPLLLVVGSQLLANTSGFQQQRSVFEGLDYLWNHILTFILPAEVFHGDEPSWFAVFRLWVVRVVLAAAAVLAYRSRRAISSLTIGLAAASAVICVLLLSAYFLLGPTYIEIRHASVLFVPLILFCSSLAADLFRDVSETASKRAVLAAGLLVLASFSYSLINLYPGTVKRGDWARIAGFIEQNETAGQPIVIFTAFDALALPYYYHGPNKILPDEKYFAFDWEAPPGTEDSLRRQTDLVISEIPPDASMIWLAVNEKCLTTEACRPLENFIRSNYTIELEKEFYLEKLYLLRKKQ